MGVERYAPPATCGGVPFRARTTDTRNRAAGVNRRARALNGRGSGVVTRELRYSETASRARASSTPAHAGGSEAMNAEPYFVRTSCSSVMRLGMQGSLQETLTPAQDPEVPGPAWARSGEPTTR